MIGFHKRSITQSNQSELTKDRINIPQRTHIRNRNLIIKPEILQDKRFRNNMSFLKELMSMTVGTHFLKYHSVHSKKDKSGDRKQGGVKNNRIKTIGTNLISRNYPAKKESLYEKALKKAKSLDQRMDFQESVKEITGKRILNTKRSQLSNHQQGNTRFKTEFNHPQSATIIIQLKKLFNNKAQYSFVKNDYELVEKQEPIHSTAYTNINQSVKHLANSRSLNERTKSAGNRRLVKKQTKVKKNSIAISQNDFIPWVKQSERVLNQAQLQFGNIFERSER